MKVRQAESHLYDVLRTLRESHQIIQGVRDLHRIEGPTGTHGRVNDHLDEAIGYMFAASAELWNTIDIIEEVSDG